MGPTDIRWTTLVLVAVAGCAATYNCTFDVARASSPSHQPEPIERDDLRAEIVVDTARNALVLDLTNDTDQVLQFDWAHVSITRPTGEATTLRPDVDLGWLAPGARVEARLIPIALPRTGKRAAANNGRTFELAIPATVRRESKIYRYTLIAHVREV
jgi:hypothetical protein